MTPASSFANYSRRLRAFIACGGRADPAQFHSLVHGLFTLQFASVAPYRRLCEARRVTPDSLTDWRQIPAVPAGAFKEVEFTSLAPAERTAVFHSSGTTEHRPGRHFHSRESLAVYEASLLPWFEQHVLARAGDCEPPARFLCLAPPPAQAPHSSLVHMFATVGREFGAAGRRFAAAAGAGNSWLLQAVESLAALKQAEQIRQPLVLLGTAFMFVHLLDALEQRALSVTLPPGSRVMETGGYKGRSRELPRAGLHALITSRLGVPPGFIICEYGMSELSSQAYDGRAEDTGQVTSDTPAASTRTFRFPPWCRALVISPETGREVTDGETGLLRIFDLANVRSVLALQTEDLAVRCGSGFQLVGRDTRAEARGCSLLVA